MPPQTDKLSILRAVLAQIAGRGGDSSPSGFDATMRGIGKGPNPSGFDATMRDTRLTPPLLSQTDPYYSSLEAQVPSGDWYSTGPRSGSRYPIGAFGRTALGDTPMDEVFSKWNSPTTKTVHLGNGKYTTVTTDSNVPKDKPSKSSMRPADNKMESDVVSTPSSKTNADVMGFDAALRGEGASDRARPVQSSGKPAPKASTQASGKPATSGSQASPQQGKPSESGKSAPVGKAEPSGEALSYFRKNKTSAGWDALGTGVSLVQQSMKPEKGGLKSRTEYDRLLRGSDNFKKLEGNEQQRVRQAFAQWMNEQNIFKGKA
jgi:hypothetical protein